MAIRIKTKKAPVGYDPGASKFFGAPTIPEGWLEIFEEDEIFLCQLRLADLAAEDPGHRLPPDGYLYFFLHTEGGLRADVRYYGGEPTVALEDFNAAVEGYEGFNQPWLMEFCQADGESEGNRLLGLPADWPYADRPPQLLLQFDPLDGDHGFLAERDGFLYFFFGEDERDFSAVTLHQEFF